MFDECNKKSVYCVNIKNTMNRIMIGITNE